VVLHLANICETVGLIPISPKKLHLFETYFLPHFGVSRSIKSMVAVSCDLVQGHDAFVKLMFKI
jgi:hypothetical protein